MKRIPAAIVALIALTAPAAAQEPGDIGKGAVLAMGTCAQCHAVRAGKFHSPNRKAPSFASVAMTSGMTERAVLVWLQTSHPTMPNFILTGTERRELAAYIMSLKPERPQAE